MTVSETPAALTDRSKLTGLIEAAIGHEDASVSRMLRHIAEVFSGFGCVLWETAPGADPDAEPPQGNLFVLADWFPEDVRLATHDLPIDGTATGEVVRSETPGRFDNVRKQGGVTRDQPFFETHGIEPMVSAPLTFLEGRRGALNVYRTAEQPVFDDLEVRFLQEFAAAVPALYQATRDHVGFELLREVDEILRQAETCAEQSALSKEVLRQFLKDITARVAKTFHCLEVSIYLKDPSTGAGLYELQATNWPGGVEKKAYDADEQLGVTGWVLQHKKSVRLFDLRLYAIARRDSENDYPGLNWKRSDWFLGKIAECLKSNEEGLPPISYMASPVLTGDEVLGAIRCCTAEESPYFYSERELHLLELIAAQVGQCWSTWLARCAMQREKESWQAIVDGTNRLNSFVQAQLANRNWQENNILKKALRFIGGEVKDAALDVRLLDQSSQELYIAETRGKAWAAGTRKQIRERMALRFPIGKPGQRPQSIGEFVFRRPEVYVTYDLGTDPHLWQASPFKDGQRLITAPIALGDNVLGVLDIIGFGDKEFPSHAPVFAELLGRQLGLYLSAVRSMDQLRRAEMEARGHVTELQKFQVQQQRMFEDLSHQLKGPLSLSQRRLQLALKRVDDTSAFRRDAIALSKQIHDQSPQHQVDNVVKDLPFVADLRRDQLALRGLVRKADRVTKSMRLLAELGTKKTISIVRDKLDVPRLKRLLIEAAQDAELYVPANRDVRFHVNRDSISGRYLSRVYVDHDLLEQAINNLYDNAAKYSFSHTEVVISGGVTGKGRFQISVANEGLKIRSVEISQCIQRGWRSDDATWTTGEGSGIGLWIVDNIMKAHGGDLVIDATNTEGITTVRLVFPLSD